MRTFQYYFILSLSIIFLLLPRPSYALTDADPNFYKTDIPLFLNAGADAYLAWQFSGDPQNPFENDPFSFFQNGETCKVLQSFASQYPGKIGVNIFNFQNRHQGGSMDGRNIAPVDLGYLKNNCGTSIVRYFGTDNPPAVVSALGALKNNGIKGIIALHNFAIGGQLSYFQRGNYDQSLTNAIGVAKRIVAAGLEGSVYTLELSNEPHCGNDPTCLPNYVQWIKDMVAAIRGQGYNGPISIGQATQISRDSRGDSVTDTYLNSQTDFEFTNSLSGITHTSGHHYDTVNENLKAIDLSKKIGKTFYVGEAASGNSTDKKVILNQLAKPLLSRGQPPGGLPTNNTISQGSDFAPFYFRKNNTVFPFNYLETADRAVESLSQNYGGGYGGLGMGYIPDEITRELPEIINNVRTGVFTRATTIQKGGDLATIIDGLGPDFRDFLWRYGSGYAFTTFTRVNKLSQIMRNLYDFISGSSPRALSETVNGEKEADDWLCRLAASANPKNSDILSADLKYYKLFDTPLMLSGNATENIFLEPDKTLQNGDPDRRGFTTLSASSLYCYRQSKGLLSCDSIRYGAPGNICGSNVSPLSDKDYNLYWVIFQKRVLEENNHAAKAILTRCQIIDEARNCDDIQKDLPGIDGSEQRSRMLSKVGWGGMSLDHRDAILNMRGYEGNYYQSVLSKNPAPNSTGICKACMATVFYLPNLVRGSEVACSMSDNLSPDSWKVNKEEVVKTNNVKETKSFDFNKNGSKNWDPLAPAGLQNEYNDNRLQLAPKSKDILSIFQTTFSILFRTTNWYTQIPCETRSQSFGDNELGKGVLAQVVNFLYCQENKSHPIEQTVYLPGYAAYLPACIKNFNSNLLPQKTITQLETKEKSKPAYDTTHATIKTKINNCQSESVRDAAIAAFLGQDYQGCDNSLDGKSKLNGENIPITKNTDSWKTAGDKNLLPQSYIDNGYLDQ